MPSFLEELSEHILLGDGAMGTHLYALGARHEQCLEELNLKNPALVQQVHEEYLAAGARVIETNTLGANRIRLARFRLQEEASAINREAAALACRAAAGKNAYVAGSVGSLGLRALDAPLDPQEKQAIFREQIQALLEGGAQIIFLETFTDLEELLLALGVARSLGAAIPVIASVAVGEEGRLASGEDLATAWKRLRAAGAHVCGLNGGCGVQASVHLLSDMALEEAEYVSVFPNAGKPEFYEGRFNYTASPAYFAANLPLLVGEGARLVGGDYGTEPAHIAAMAAVVEGLRPIRSKPLRSRRISIHSATAAPRMVSEVQEESLLDRLARKTVHIVEFDAPKTFSLEKFLTGAQALQKAGVDAITLADNSLAILRISNFAAAVYLREKLGLTCLLHVACRDRNLLGLQSEFMGLGMLGFRHVLALTGDPAKSGDHPGATSVYDLTSVGLIKLLAGMNRGVNAIGNDLRGRTQFVIGCAFNPNSKHFDSQIKKLESKIAAGAQYVLTQPIFDPALARMTAQRLKPLGVPVFMGIMPLLHARNAEFLHNEVPGIQIPQEFRDQLRSVGDAKAPDVSIALAREIRQIALETFRGVYIITPFFRYDLSLALVES